MTCCLSNSGGRPSTNADVKNSQRNNDNNNNNNNKSAQENETYKILWGLEIKTDHLISARRPDLVIVNKQKKKKKKKKKKKEKRKSEPAE